MSSKRQSKDAAWAAAEGREYLRGELEGKDPEFINRFAGMVDSRETLDLLNYLCSIWPGEFLETRLAEEVITSANTRNVTDAFEHGNISQLKGMVGLTDNRETGTDAIHKMASAAAREGFIGTLTGVPGSGKTSLMTDVAMAWTARTGGHVIGNIESWDFLDDVVSTDVEMVDAMESYRGQVLAVIDEAGQVLTGSGTDQQAANEFAKTLKLVRKRGDGKYARQGSVLLVAHTRKGVTAELRRITSQIWDKPSREDPGLVDIYDCPEDGSQPEKIDSYRGLTDTSASFNEHESSAFEVTSLEDDEDDRDQVNADDVRDDVHTETAIRAVKPWSDDDGMSYPDVAGNGEDDGLVPYSRGWVGRRVREWKDGQHRDLIPDPRGDGGGESA